ncbi:DUF4358 domain-containing protein [Peptostreptococcus sp. D1]|uniref:DUF4358 domain-containing protein n=1 Tax=Peptostreptococcus sp. D1 TaxID=72304 RepID=UPI0008F43C0C|nr:DUF4358 domain-containing protein [Peptostreptococcus sp. D1]SFE72516.1 protein of unknown function [Peptostreptococcus sp. D1]
MEKNNEKDTPSIDDKLKDSAKRDSVKAEGTETDSNKNVFKDINLEQTARLRTIKSEDIESKGRGKKVSEMVRKPLKTSSIYKKKYTILALIVFFSFVLAYQFVKVKNLDFTKLNSNIEKRVDMVNFVKGNDIDLKKLYGINKLEVDNYALFAPKSNMEANEILILKVKGDTSDYVSRIQKRIDAQSSSFKNYAPAQYEILKKADLVEKGQYIYFISYKDLNVVYDAISNSYK